MFSKKIIVVYKSKTGFTEKYAKWIAEALHCDIVRFDGFNIEQMACYDIVILGGGIYAGRINGANLIKNNASSFSEKKVIVFAAGASAPIPQEIERYEKHSIPQDMNIEFFYFQSGMNYTRMNGTDKLLMTAFKTILKLKKNKSAVEQGTNDAIQRSYDYSNINQIDPLVNYAKTIELE